MQHTETKIKSERQDNSDHSTELIYGEIMPNSSAGASFVTLTVSRGYGCAR